MGNTIIVGLSCQSPKMASFVLFLLDVLGQFQGRDFFASSVIVARYAGFPVYDLFIVFHYLKPTSI